MILPFEVDGGAIPMTVSGGNGRVGGIASSSSKGKNYILTSISTKKPVVIGVDYKEKYSIQRDYHTDHFMVVYGVIYYLNPNSVGFLYADPGTGSYYHGFGRGNVLRDNNGYLQDGFLKVGGDYKHYTLTSVRTTK